MTTNALPARSRIVESDDGAILQRIEDDDVALAIWHRPPKEGLADWLDALPAKHLPEGHFVGPAACVPARLATLCDLVELADGPERRSLVNDIAGLARLFAARTGSPDVDLRLEALDHDGFLEDYSSADFLHQRGQTAQPEDTRTVVDLLVEQVEFADVIVVNKADLLSADDLGFLTTMLRRLNATARIVTSEFGQVPLDQLLDTKLFSYEKASQAPGWMKEMRGIHTPESETYGFWSFVYKARRPFHPMRLYALLNGRWDGVIRSKGFFWLASRMNFAGSVSQAGGMLRHEAAGAWWAAVKREEWPQDSTWRATIRNSFKSPYGDRRQEIVFIGTKGMDRKELTRRLDDCLLNDTEMKMGPAMWGRLPDPFPVWKMAGQA